MTADQRTASPAPAGQLERELVYYRRECNELGARLLRLQEEQGQALREALRSRLMAKMVREAHRLTDAEVSPVDLGSRMLELIVENMLCDCAAFMVEEPAQSGRFVPSHAVGTKHCVEQASIASPPSFAFTSSLTRAAPLESQLAAIMNVPYVLWAYDRPAGHALILGNRAQTNITPPFQPGDREFVEGGLSVYLDVLARKQAEVELRQAIRVAEEASEAKAVFLATLSHELRTPLDSILGYSEMLAGGERKLAHGEYRTYGAQIYESGRHLQRLIEDILDYSSIARGQLKLRLEWVRLAQAVQGAVQAAAPHASKRAVQLKVEPIDSALSALVDSRRFRQVLDNLLDNAIKFTEAGGSASVTLAQASDGSLDIVLRDTGIGMRAEDIPKAFEPFRQLDDARTRSAPGTGLGLPIARSLMEAHGGNLRIDSSPGRGTAVTITLPPANVAVGESASHQLAAEVPLP